MTKKSKEEYFEEFQQEKLDQEKLRKAESKASKLGEIGDTFLLMVEMAKDILNGKFNISKKDMVILAGAIIYVVSPFDAIPDVIPILGWTDDAGIVALAVKSLSDVISEYKKTKNM